MVRGTALRALVGIFAAAALLACAPAREREPRPIPQPLAPGRAAAPAASASASSTPLETPKTEASEPQLEPDGNDELDAADVTLPERGHFEKVGRHWAALQRVCDLTVHEGALYLAHATKPLGLGGASITRYQPQAKPPFSLAFNWNREGEPEQGGAGGQGFLRVRRIDDRLLVPDADPPYLGLRLATGIEGYLFASDQHGVFAGPRMPGHLPPRAPSGERPGAHVLPGSLHGFDVIRFRGKLYASTSAAIPPNGNAKSSPGTLLTPADAPGPWQVAFTYAGASGEASVRLGYMTRFRDRLYVAISPLYGLDRHDFLVIDVPRDSATFSAANARPVQVSAHGSAHTLRWYTDGGRLYWLSIGAAGAELRVSSDGERFRLLALPPDAGYPSDVLRVGQELLVLAEHGLYRLEADAFRLRARVPETKTPFKVDDGYCAAPLAVFEGSLYAGDQLSGALWRFVAD